MFISSAYAQGAGGGGSGLEAMLPLVLIFVVFYFLLIRPQQKKMKDHKQMLGNIRRGDIVITGGGITGKVTKVDNEHEVTVEIAKDVRVKVQRSLISGVQTKGEPVKGGAANENANQKSGGGVLGKLFGRLFEKHPRYGGYLLDVGLACWNPGEMLGESNRLLLLVEAG